MHVCYLAFKKKASKKRQKPTLIYKNETAKCIILPKNDSNIEKNDLLCTDKK